MYPNLKLQLWKLGIRQNGLARSLSVDETVLSKIVNGYRTPTVRLRKQIAALLESEEAWLFESLEAKPTLSGPIALGQPLTNDTEPKS